ncbi:MAG: relaxase/mobilization nuclease domain-containing protein, partial [Acidobacteria bacterium]|nr:relaxase/mobilization nuclease domain-containing protein [Acidobacteriota bacterium]
MIQKIVAPGGGFRGVLNYLLASEKDPVVLAGTLPGTTPRELAGAFGHSRSLNPRVAKPVFHASLALPPGEELTDQQWRQAVADYLETLGYGSSDWVAIQHRDTDHSHVHIVASRIDGEGKRVPDFQERRRGEAKVRELEAELGLTRVAPSLEASKAAPSRDELAAFETTGGVSVRAQLQAILDASLEDRPTLSDLLVRLETQGVGITANVQSTGRVAGWSFELDGVAIKASSLGKGYTLPALQKAGRLDFDPERDLAALRTLDRGARPAPATELPRIPSQEPGTSPGPPPAASPPESPIFDRNIPEHVYEELRGHLEPLYAEPRPLLEFQARLADSGVELHLETQDGHAVGWRFQLGDYQVDPIDLGPRHDPLDLLQTGALSLSAEDLPKLAAFAASAGPAPRELDLRRHLDRAQREELPLFETLLRLRTAGFSASVDVTPDGRLASWRFRDRDGALELSLLGPAYELRSLLEAGRFAQPSPKTTDRLATVAALREISPRDHLQQRLDEALDRSSGLASTVLHLHQLGIQTELERDTNGNIHAWRFQADGRAFDPSVFGPEYELGRLQQGGRLAYDPRSEQPLLETLATFSRASTEERLREHLAASTRDRPDLETLDHRLQARGFRLHLELDASGQPAAWSFERGGTFVHPSVLGADHTLAAFEEQGRLASSPRPPSLPAGPRTFEARLRSTLSSALEETPTFGPLVARLRSHGVEVLPERDVSGRVLGWSFQADGRTVSAASLGEDLAFRTLTASGRLDYRPERDHWALDALPGPPKASDVARVRSTLTEALADSPGLQNLVRRLRAAEIDVRPQFDSHHRVTGWHFETQGRLLEASALGHDFTFSALRASRRLDYDPERDLWAFETSLDSRGISSKPILNYREDGAASELPGKLELREQLLEAARTSTTIPQYLERVEALGIEAKPRLALSGEVRSLAYFSDGRFFTATEIDPSLAWKGLQRSHGITYKPERDLPVLRARLDRFQIARHSPDSPPHHRYVPDLTGLYRQAARLQVLLRQDAHHARHSAARAKLQTAITRTQGHLSSLQRLTSRATRLEGD